MQIRQTLGGQSCRLVVGGGTVELEDTQSKSRSRPEQQFVV